MRITSKSMGVGVVCAALSTFACAFEEAEPDASGGEVTEGGGENLGTISAALDPSIHETYYDDTDSTGNLSVRIYKCKPSAVRAYPVTYCPVEDDYVLIGGGAEVVGTPSPGAMLTASYALSNRWIASSKDHYSSNPHQVRAWAVGLKLRGTVAATLRNDVTTVTVASASGTQPSAVAQITDSNYILVGGGAYVSTTGPGQLLTASFPAGANAWYASSKQHLLSSHGLVNVQAIGIRKRPSGLSYCLARSVRNVNNIPSNGGYSTSIAVNDNSSAVTVGFGAIARTSNANSHRFLTQVFPLWVGNGGTYATTKDHIVPGGGSTDAYAVRISHQSC